MKNRPGRFRIADINFILATTLPKCTCGGDVALSPHTTYCDLNQSEVPLLNLFGQMIVVRAEHSFMCHEIEYEAYSMLFEEVQDGHQIPKYELTYDTQTKQWTAKKLN